MFLEDYYELKKGDKLTPSQEADESLPEIEVISATNLTVWAKFDNGRGFFGVTKLTRDQITENYELSGKESVV